MVQRDSHLKTVNAKDYNKLFDVHNRDSKTLEAAFKQASDIRKFEIELYWKFLISLPLVSVLTCFFMLKKGRTHIDSHNLKVVLREVNVTSESTLDSNDNQHD